MQILFKVFMSPLPLVLKDQLSMQLLCDLRSELAVGLFCWNIWKHILKSTVAFLNLSNCQGQAEICGNWNWHFLSKFIDDIKTKTVFLLFLYNILPYNGFQHLKAPSCGGDDGHWTSLVPYRRPIAAVRRGSVGELKLSPSCHF